MPPITLAAVARSFRVAFHQDVNGVPAIASSGVVDAITLSAADAQERFAFSGVQNGFDGIYYDYRATLPTPVPVAANTRYWMLIRADTGNSGVSWGWRVGRPDNGISVDGMPRGPITLPKDHAFSLSGR